MIHIYSSSFALFAEGLSFNQSLYSLVVDADVPMRSVLFDLGGRDRVDNSVLRRIDSKLYTSKQILHAHTELHTFVKSYPVLS